ncbi:MAG: hypothetical protein H7A25_05175 [Leptospiraceae bacterium]|nr:hypothetical protein [Leptospiraceae bacterium]MCP5499271.1 hypothetical protein [Leptospiraceae bacterium]
MKILNYFFVFFLLLLFSHCGVPSGNFGWHVSDEREIDLLEKELFVVTEYTVTRENLFFSPKDTIHFMYMFDRSPGSGKSFIVTLEKESLGFVEIEVKTKSVEKDTNYLKGKFENLAEGKYRLNIVHDQNVIDTVMFNIIPEEGFSFTTDRLSEDAEETDEIIKYSR